MMQTVNTINIQITRHDNGEIFETLFNKFQDNTITVKDLAAIVAEDAPLCMVSAERSPSENKLTATANFSIIG